MPTLTLTLTLLLTLNPNPNPNPTPTPNPNPNPNLGMLASGGILEGKRLLSAASVRLLMSDYNDEGQACQG